MLKEFKPTKYIDFYSSPHPVQAKIARVIARAIKGLTVYEAADLAQCSTYAVRELLKTMQSINSVYICEWRRTSDTALTAVYAVGSLPTAKKPQSVRAQRLIRKKTPTPTTKKVEVVEDSPEVLYYKALAKALVPERTPQEVCEVNWKYLCYINPDVVKYFSATT